jgi:hypothetical protein
MANKKLKFREEVIDKVFPDKFTKMRMEDFTNKAVDNKDILTEKEFDALTNQRIDMANRNYKGCFEFMAKKEKNKIELISLEN